MPRGNLFALALSGMVTFFCWQASEGAKPKDEMMQYYGIFVDAVEQVEANYVRKVSRKELVETALQGMLQNLDPHSQFINTSEWKSFKRKIEGRFGGIGITVGQDENTNRLKVIAPMVGTPAYEGGILAGDQIVEIDGQSAEGVTADKAVEILTGRPGTSVKLAVLHEGSDKPVTITLNRAIINVPSILGDTRKPDDQWDLLIDKDKKIGYVRVSSFMQDTYEELKKALSDLKAEGMKGLILDLRDNPGGLLSSAVEVSDLFLDKGLIVSTKGRNTQPKKYEAQRDSNGVTDVPMVILVNQGSASAAEIVSACLQDHNRAVVVGQRSFGKGSVQNIIDLDDGNSVLKLTVAAYYRPSGKNIHRFKNAKDSDEWGVSPNPGMEVKLTTSQFIEWARGRIYRDMISHAKGHRPAPEPADPKAEQPKDGADKPEKPKADEKKSDEKKADEKGSAKGPGEAKSKSDDEKVPFVDRQLDKALAIIKEKLAAPATGK